MGDFQLVIKVLGSICFQEFFVIKKNNKKKIRALSSCSVFNCEVLFSNGGWKIHVLALEFFKSS